MFSIKKVSWKQFGGILAPFTEAHDDYFDAENGYGEFVAVASKDAEAVILTGFEFADDREKMIAYALGDDARAKKIVKVAMEVCQLCDEWQKIMKHLGDGDHWALREQRDTENDEFVRAAFPDDNDAVEKVWRIVAALRGWESWKSYGD